MSSHDPQTAPITDAELEARKHSEADPRVPALILNRWSPRAFTDRAVLDRDLRTILTGASWAASSYNEQPWRFLLGRRPDETYNKLLGTLGAFNQVWAQKAPVLVLIVGKPVFSHSGEQNRFAFHDLGAVNATLGLTASALGLHTHSMAGYDTEAARSAFNIPEDYEMGALTALGYFGEHARLDGALLERETMERKRKPLEELVFTNTFGQSANL